MSERVLQQIKTDLQSNNPKLREFAESKLRQLETQSKAPQEAFHQEKLLESIRKDMQSENPALIQHAMEAQERLNKQAGHSDWGRHLARGAKNVVKGAVETVELPVSAVRAVNGWVTGDRNWDTLGEKLSHYADKLTSNYTLPTSKKEKIADRVAESIATVPGVGTLGKVLSGVPKVGKFLTQAGKLNSANIASAAGSGAASQIAENELPDNALAQIAAGIGGGIAGGYGAHASMKGISKGMGINKGAVANYRAAEIPYGLFDVSEKQLVHILKDKLAKSLGSQKHMKGYRKSQIEGVNKSLGNLGRDSLGTERESLAVKGAGSYLAAKKAKIDTLYKKLRDYVSESGSPDIPQHALGEWLDSLDPQVRESFLKSNKGSAGFVKKLLERDRNRGKPLFESKKTGELRQNPSTGSFEFSEHPVQIGKERGVSYDYAKDIQSDVGKHLKKNVAARDATDAQLAHLYGIMGKDIDTAIRPGLEKLGEEAVSHFESIPSHYSHYAKHEKPYLNNILGHADKDFRTGIYSSLGKEPEILAKIMADLKKNGRGLELSLQGLSSPEEKKKLAQGILQKLGERQGEFVPHVLQTSLAKLPKPTVKLLLGTYGEDLGKFTATLSSIKNAKKVMEAANHSGSAHHIGAYKDLSKFSEAALETAHSLGEGKGISRKALSRTADIARSLLLAKGLSSQKVVDSLLKADKKMTTKEIVQAALRTTPTMLSKQPLKINISPDRKEKYDESGRHKEYGK